MYARLPKTLALGLVLAFALAACVQRWNGSVGAILAKDNLDGRLYVREAPAGMSAAKVGIAVGDEVTAIDGRPASSMTADEVHAALSGAVGSKVKVTVRRDGQSLTFDVERGPLRGG